MKFLVPPIPAFTTRGEFLRLLALRNIDRMGRQYYVWAALLAMMFVIIVSSVITTLGFGGFYLALSIVAAALTGWWATPIVARHWGEPTELRNFPKPLSHLPWKQRRQYNALRYEAGILILKLEEDTVDDRHAAFSRIEECKRRAWEIIYDSEEPVQQLGW